MTLILRPLRYGDEHLPGGFVEAFADADRTSDSLWLRYPSYLQPATLIRCTPDEGEVLPETFVPNSYLVGIVDGQVIGKFRCASG